MSIIAGNLILPQVFTQKPLCTGTHTERLVKIKGARKPPGSTDVAVPSVLEGCLSPVDLVGRLMRCSVNASVGCMTKVCKLSIVQCLAALSCALDQRER